MQSKYYKIHEFVPEHIYKKFGEKAWRFINTGLIRTYDKLKERFPKGSITINNYFWGGDRHWSGLRTPNSPYYSETSIHTFGGAGDSVFSAYTAEEVRQDIINHPEEYPDVKGIEMGISWLHVDTRNEDKVQLFYPN